VLALSTATSLASDYNLFFGVGGTPAMATGCNTSGGCFSYYAPSGWRATGQDLHSLQADPMFLSSSDFHVSPTSPAINTGTSTRAPATDFDGVARPQGAGFDIGAFER
ncbi:MAG TPA: choice-of-anchor Q domain-containing protein, partial [Anaeromyxobacteraceae bacterium]